MSTQTVNVSGMTCQHCVHSVTEEVGAIDGVTNVAVDLNAGGASVVTVTADAPVTDEALAAAITEAGYAIVPPRSLI